LQIHFEDKLEEAVKMGQQISFMLLLSYSVVS